VESPLDVAVTPRSVIRTPLHVLLPTSMLRVTLMYSLIVLPLNDTNSAKDHPSPKATDDRLPPQVVEKRGRFACLEGANPLHRNKYGAGQFFAPGFLNSHLRCHRNGRKGVFTSPTRLWLAGSS